MIKKIIAKILKGLPAFLILTSGIAGIYASVTKLADISLASGIILIVIFLLYLLGIFLDREKKAE